MARILDVNARLIPYSNRRTNMRTLLCLAISSLNIEKIRKHTSGVPTLILFHLLQSLLYLSYFLKFHVFFLKHLSGRAKMILQHKSDV